MKQELLEKINTTFEANFETQEGFKSSNLKTIGYDEDRQLLLVEFNYGGIYVYEGVPSVVLTGMLSADSAGKFLSKNIKGIFEFTKVEA